MRGKSPSFLQWPFLGFWGFVCESLILSVRKRESEKREKMGVNLLVYALYFVGDGYMEVARDLGVLGVHLGLGFVLFIGWIGRNGPQDVFYRFFN